MLFENNCESYDSAISYWFLPNRVWCFDLLRPPYLNTTEGAGGIQRSGACGADCVTWDHKNRCSVSMECINAKYISQKISATRWRPVSAASLQQPELFATGSWDNEARTQVQNMSTVF